MKNTFLAIAIAGLSTFAMATQPSNPCGNKGNNCQVGGSATGVGIAGAAASAANHTAVGVIVGGGSASIDKGAVTNTVSPTATGNTGTIQGGTATTGAIDNKSTATAGSVGNVGAFGSVKNLSPESSSTSSVLGSGNSAAVQGQNSSVDIKVEGDNQFTVDAAKALAGAEGTRSLTDVQVSAIEADARIEAARLAQTIKNTPSVSGPPLVSSNDACMGSTSGSANGPGIGIGFGTTWTEENCVMLKNSRELWNMGMKAASLAMMCNDAKNKEALELTGFECPQTTKARQAGAPAAAATAAGEPTDPFVRARMGLPALAAAK